MKKSFEILGVIQAICDGQISRNETNNLVEVCQKIAFTYLKYRHKNISRALLAEDVTLTELSIESIANLFECDSSGNFVQFKKLIHSWKPKIVSEDGALFFLNTLVSKNTENYVSSLLRTSDPFFSKILDSLNYIITKENYCKKRVLGVTYIFQNDEETPSATLPDSDFINTLPADLFVSKKKMLGKIFSYIKIQTKYACAIPINTLVMRIKKINAAEFICDTSMQIEDELEIDRIVNKALKLTLEKIHHSYLEKDKLTDDEVSKIEEAFRRISIDMKDGGIAVGLHKYFLDQFSAKTIKDYHSEYQNIFEYLFQIFKNEIVIQIKDY